MADKRSRVKLRVINERLDLSSHLIDQIVYRRYGLTEVEITLVEERKAYAVTSGLQRGED